MEAVRAPSPARTSQIAQMPTARLNGRNCVSLHVVKFLRTSNTVWMPSSTRPSTPTVRPVRPVLDVITTSKITQIHNRASCQPWSLHSLSQPKHSKDSKHSAGRFSAHLPLFRQMPLLRAPSCRLNLEAVIQSMFQFYQVTPAKHANNCSRADPGIAALTVITCVLHV